MANDPGYRMLVGCRRISSQHLESDKDMYLPVHCFFQAIYIMGQIADVAGLQLGSTVLSYVDDVAVLADSEGKIQEAVSRMEEEARKLGLPSTCFLGQDKGSAFWLWYASNNIAHQKWGRPCIEH